MENRQTQLAKTGWICNDINSNDLPVLKSEAEHSRELSTWRPDESDRSTNQRRLHEPRCLREGNRSLGPVSCSSDFSWGARTSARFVHADHDIWVQHCEQSFEVTSA